MNRELFILLVLCAFGSQAAGLTERGRTIVAFGDSTTARRGPLKIYSGLLAEANPKNHVINAGIGGHNTDHARQRFEKDVLARNPDVVIIQFGINDAAVDVWKQATKPRVPIARYEENLRFFVSALKQRNAKVILMTPNPIRWTVKLKKLYGKPPYRAEDPNGFNVLLKNYAKVVRQVAVAEKLPLIDVYRLFEQAEDIDALLLDGMHPNNRGHQIVADSLLAELAR